MCNREINLPSPLKACGLLCVPRTVAHRGDGFPPIGATMRNAPKIIEFSISDLEDVTLLFERRVSRNSGLIPKSSFAEGECWKWIDGSKYPERYGIFSFKGRKYLAHRVSLMLARGIEDQSKYALHKCDNPKCVNPDHLFWGTIMDNSVDMMKKGRGKWREYPLRTHCKRGHIWNEENTMDKKHNSGRIGKCCKLCKRVTEKKQEGTTQRKASNDHSKRITGEKGG